MTWLEKGALAYLMILILLILLALMSGCATTKDERGFWDQSVITSAWGFTMVTPYGPFNFGYLSWQRNPKVIQEQAKPEVSKLPFAIP